MDSRGQHLEGDEGDVEDEDERKNRNRKSPGDFKPGGGGIDPKRRGKI